MTEGVAVDGSDDGSVDGETDRSAEGEPDGFIDGMLAAPTGIPPMSVKAVMNTVDVSTHVPLITGLVRT